MCKAHWSYFGFIFSQDLFNKFCITFASTSQKIKEFSDFFFFTINHLKLFLIGVIYVMLVYYSIPTMKYYLVARE